MTDLQQLRQSLRAQRRQVTAIDRENAGKSLLKHFIDLPFLANCTKIAVYLVFDGEIETQYIIEWCWQHRIAVYLPKLDPHGSLQLHFALYTPNTIMQANRFGILEPNQADQTIFDPEDLDLILLPLVAFDNNCHRLGMGGGYYDFTLKNINTKPYLIGLAFDFQRVDHLPKKTTDVSLHGIISDRFYYKS